MKFIKLTLTLLCMWNYAQAAIKMQLINDDISDVLDSCDYTRFDNQLIKLQLGHDILQQNMSNMQKNLDRQMDIVSDLQRKVNSLPQQIEGMQEKLLQNNRINMEDLKDYIRKEIQMQIVPAIVPPVDDKVVLITDMKEMLHKHDQILDEVKRKEDESQALLKEINLEKHTQSLTKTISDKLAIVPQLNATLSKIESNTISRNILTDVINNQNNIKSLLKEINLEKHTQSLTKTISDKLAIMPHMNATLSKIESSTISSNILTDVINNQNNIKSLLKEINLEKHTQSLTKTISDKLAIMPQMNATLSKIESSTLSRNILTDVINNQNNIKSLLKEINLEKHTQILKNAISDKLSIMPHMNATLGKIESKTISRNILTDVINNQNNIKSLLKEINLEKHTQSLTKTISDKLAIMPHMNATLSKIESSTISSNILTDVINNQNNIKSLLKEINLEKHTQSLTKIISDKLAIMPQMNATLSKIESSTLSRNILTDVINNQNNIKSLLKEINLEKHTQILKNAISDKLSIMPHMNATLGKIESNTISRNILTDVINNQNNIKSLLKEINLEKHTQSLTKTISEKLAIMPQMNATLSKIESSTISRNILTDVINNQNNIKSLLKEINLEKHTQILKNAISDKLVIVPQMNAKLSKIESSTISRNILTDVINNQNNIKSLLKEINLEKHTQSLTKTISEKLAIMPQMNATLSKIESSTISRNILTDVINNQNNIKSLLKEINLEKHTQILKNAISDKLVIVPQMNAKLSKIESSTISRNILTDVINNQNNIKSLLKEINLEKHTQSLTKTISEKLAIMPQMNSTLSKIESNTISRNILTDVINNQNNIKSLLKEINLEKHTQILKNAISDKLVIVPQMNAKLSKIESNIIPKTDHLQFYHDIQQFFHKEDKLCLIETNQNIICTSHVNPTSCVDYDDTICADNKCPIVNDLYGRKPFLVACNNSVEGGGWMVIQRRINGSVDFYRNWSDYKTGFGEIDGEFFIGLDKLHALTSTLKPVELLIQLQDLNSTIKYAKYDDFLVGNETENYKLKKVGSYTGNAGDSFSAHEGFEFTTKDRDNDKFHENCAITCAGAWWYTQCYYSNLNGRYHIGIRWLEISRNISLNFVEMLIRPKRL